MSPRQTFILFNCIKKSAFWLCGQWEVTTSSQRTPWTGCRKVGETGGGGVRLKTEGSRERIGRLAGVRFIPRDTSPQETTLPVG
jgi:hypothetical protein